MAFAFMFRWEVIPLNHDGSLGAYVFDRWTGDLKMVVKTERGLSGTIVIGNANGVK